MKMSLNDDLALLRKYARETDNGKWTFETGFFPVKHDAESALVIIKACLALDIPVTDVLTAQAWWAVVRRITELEAAGNGDAD
jgi:hypothetical protein